MGLLRETMMVIVSKLIEILPTGKMNFFDPVLLKYSQIFFNCGNINFLALH